VKHMDGYHYGGTRDTSRESVIMIGIVLRGDRDSGERPVETVNTDHMQDATEQDHEAGHKRQRLWSHAGREIVRPGFSAVPRLTRSGGERSRNGMAHTKEARGARRQRIRPVAMLRAQTGKEHERSLGEGSSTSQLGKATTPGTMLVPRCCPPGLTRTQWTRVQKLRAREIEERRKESKRDRWFNQE
jgi:hypothetical protein